MDCVEPRRRKSDRLQALIAFAYRVIAASAVVALVVYALADAALMFGSGERIHARVPPEFVQPASAKK